MLTDLRYWGRTRVVMLANFHYNSIMTLSVYISAKHTIIGYINLRDKTLIAKINSEH